MWFPASIVNDMHRRSRNTLSASGIAAPYRDAEETLFQQPGNEEDSWSEWEAMMRQYRDDSDNSLQKLSFWLVISLPGDDYSGKVEWHSTAPMLIPSSGTGTLLGLAKTRDELESMMFEDSKRKNGEPGNVHLTYKVKVQGKQAWNELLDFLATHDMLEKD